VSDTVVRLLHGLTADFQSSGWWWTLPPEWHPPWADGRFLKRTRALEKRMTGWRSRLRI